MSDSAAQCTLKYLAKGLRPTRESQQKLQDELHDALPNVRSVVVLPVVDGFSVELEIDDMAPFTRSSIEPYVAEHVLPEAVAIGCRTSEPVDLLLLKAHFA